MNLAILLLSAAITLILVTTVFSVLTFMRSQKVIERFEAREKTAVDQAFDAIDEDPINSGVVVNNVFPLSPKKKGQEVPKKVSLSLISSSHSCVFLAPERPRHLRGSDCSGTCLNPTTPGRVCFWSSPQAPQCELFAPRHVAKKQAHP